MEFCVKANFTQWNFVKVPFSFFKINFEKQLLFAKEPLNGPKFCLDRPLIVHCPNLYDDNIPIIHYVFVSKYIIFLAGEISHFFACDTSICKNTYFCKFCEIIIITKN